VKRHGANTAEDHETWDEGDTARTLNTHANSTGTNGALAVTGPVAFEQNQRDEVRETAVAGALQAQSGSKMETRIMAGAVRRLTPTECERLQGFPDGWTAISTDAPDPAPTPPEGWMALE
jgi:DNA (cytosine-5)-methyltransferase 1